MLEAVAAVMAEAAATPHILCGDFNIPQSEMRDGRIVTWGQDIVAGEARCGDAGKRLRTTVDAAERIVMAGE